MPLTLVSILYVVYTFCKVHPQYRQLAFTLKKQLFDFEVKSYMLHFKKI